MEGQEASHDDPLGASPWGQELPPLRKPLVSWSPGGGAQPRPPRDPPPPPVPWLWPGSVGGSLTSWPLSCTFRQRPQGQRIGPPSWRIPTHVLLNPDILCSPASPPDCQTVGN